MKNAVVLWTGGKDSALAYFELKDKYNIVKFVTFVPKTDKKFVAHPVELMKAQSSSIGAQHEFVKVGEPFKEGYIDAMKQLKKEGIEVVITGDISTINGQPNFIEECCKGLLEIDMPLWEHDRRALLDKFIENNFEILISLSYKKDFEEHITGRRLDKKLVEELKVLQDKTGIDPCGENGEYHTNVLDAPYFNNKIDLGFTVEEKEQYHSINIENITATPKN
ncbi:diphthine--ammonia ligase [Flammeovirga sp. OC4]|uniref:Dph6-related ATP pyrophosphatase n=1 Tax=Flammeovirga sp. OC4 TaxID=1382345 RepID=UPI0006943D2A|nr:diphthine--ammonia ligase [Flammeovirga sp. OC4]